MNDAFAQRLETIETTIVQQRQEKDLRMKQFRQNLKIFISSDIQPLLEQTATVFKKQGFHTKINPPSLLPTKVTLELVITSRDGNNSYMWQLNTSNDNTIIKLEVFQNTRRYDVKEIAFVLGRTSMYEDSLAGFYQKVLEDNHR
jgi:uncharacterized radical SAM superfamily Fe-S cluster-containing enzyme